MAPLSFAAVAEKRVEDTKPLSKVQLSGHVVLKIAKHCKECMPALVTGQLLGLDVGQTLEVTDSFPFPVRPCLCNSNNRLCLLLVSLCMQLCPSVCLAHPPA